MCSADTDDSVYTLLLGVSCFVPAMELEYNIPSPWVMIRILIFVTTDTIYIYIYVNLYYICDDSGMTYHISYLKTPSFVVCRRCDLERFSDLQRPRRALGESFNRRDRRRSSNRSTNGPASWDEDASKAFRPISPSQRKQINLPSLASDVEN